jgi:hypothetical protein
MPEIILYRFFHQLPQEVSRQREHMAPSIKNQKKMNQKERFP